MLSLIDGDCAAVLGEIGLLLLVGRGAVDACAPDLVSAVATLAGSTGLVWVALMANGLVCLGDLDRDGFGWGEGGEAEAGAGAGLAEALPCAGAGLIAAAPFPTDCWGVDCGGGFWGFKPLPLGFCLGEAGIFGFEPA